MGTTKQYKRTRNLFNPNSKVPFRLSRSKLENFFSCPRCFYLDRKLGVGTPGIPAFTLNSAVDHLLKAEFDTYRMNKKAHPLMEEYGIEAIPFAHPMIDEWRENFKGVQYHHGKTNFIIFGAVDDIWIDKNKQLYVVDYKSTSTTGPITLDGPYRQAFKRQMEIYQWLLRRQGHHVSSTGYFVYCNANKNKNMFEAKLDFQMEIISYKGDDGWVENKILEAHQCLMQEHVPGAAEDCEYCMYRQTANEADGSFQGIPSQGELFKGL